MTSAPSTPALPAELSIYTAAEIRSSWLDWLAGETAALPTALRAVDAAHVDVVDGAGVQLLLSIDRALRERGAALRLAAPSATLSAACEALGAAALLADGGLA